MQLDDRKWKEFEIYDIFNHIRGKRQIAENRKKGTIPYYSASKHQNGLTDLISNPAFTVNTNAIIYTTFGDAYYVEKGFTCSDEITILTNKSLDKYNGLFLCACINQNRNKYCFGRKAFSNKIGRDKILIPTSENGNPDYEFMTNYIKESLFKEISDLKDYCRDLIKNIELQEIENLKNKTWNEFKISHLFDVIIGKAIDGNKVDKWNGNIAYITRKESNNALDGFIDYDYDYINKDNPVITIGNETAKPFVQTYPFFTGTKVNIMKPKFKANKYILLFISQALEQHKDKYSYSYTINSTRLKEQIILLPVNEDGNPDYAYMEQYIKNIMYNQYKRYLEFLED